MQPEGIIEPTVLGLYNVLKEAVEVAESADAASRTDVMIRLAVEVGALRAGFIAAGFSEQDASVCARQYWFAMVDVLKSRALH